MIYRGVLIVGQNIKKCLKYILTYDVIRYRI